MGKTYFEIQLNDGSVERLTLTYGALYKLQNLKPDVYAQYTEIMAKKAIDELDNVKVIYIAYLCQNIDQKDAMTFEQFLERFPSDRRYTQHVMMMLLEPDTTKKKIALLNSLSKVLLNPKESQ